MRDLQIVLPIEADLESMDRAENGAAVFQGSADVVVREGSLDAIQMATITDTPDDPHAFTYEFSGHELRDLPGGDIGIGQTVDGAFVTTATIAEPWAVDASGERVQTRYLLEGGSLTQRIFPDESTEYPIVADPYISVGWGIYVTYTNSEVRQLTPWAGINNFIAALCAAIPLPYGAVCAAIAGTTGSSIYNTFVSAGKSGRCVQMRYIPAPYPPYAQLIGWKVVSC